MNLKNVATRSVPLVVAVLLMGAINSCKTAHNKVLPVQNATKSVSAFPYEILAKGNSWVVSDATTNNRIISQKGISNWSSPHTVINTYFKTENAGTIDLGLRLHGPTAASKIKVTLGENSKVVVLGQSDDAEVSIGTFKIGQPGYQTIKIEGLEKEGDVFANIEAFLIDGSATEGQVFFIKEDFYFGRRGPSVHLSYDMPKAKDVEYFYNEIKVPEGEDVIGSYYMANGFKDGYFGIQVNSETERRILFSVWSPFDTQDPKEIPDDHKIILLGKGDGVITGGFGNEGSGGQSYKVFPWKTGATYRFLLKGVPAENNSTDYTAYFFAPEQNQWQLIASFRRPQASRYLQNLYSFLENFDTRTGYIARKANYNNQWVYTTDKKWIELTRAKFTADATARKQSRLDYAGGAEEEHFFMKNCGFFNETTPMDSHFTRTATGDAPKIDFSTLEQPQG